MVNSHKNKIRRGFYLFSAWLIIQYLMVGIIGVIHSEPWPAFTLPGFKNVFDRGEFIEQKVSVFVVEGVDGEAYRIRPSRVFRDIPVSHHNGIMRHQFNPARFSSGSRLKMMTPEGYDWLRARIEEESGLMPAESGQILVVWSDHFYRIRGEEMRQVSSVPVDTLFVMRAVP
jgi:hypothetical protein